MHGIHEEDPFLSQTEQTNSSIDVTAHICTHDKKPAIHIFGYGYVMCICQTQIYHIEAYLNKRKNS